MRGCKVGEEVEVVLGFRQLGGEWRERREGRVVDNMQNSFETEGEKRVSEDLVGETGERLRRRGERGGKGWTWMVMVVEGVWMESGII